ncbi:MAG: PatB family C-S lyase [Chloroflexota bacterium]
MTSIELTIEQLRARRGTKWHRYPADVLPAWVADMDFAVPDSIQKAILDTVESRDYGYGVGPGSRTGPDGVAQAFAERMASRYDWIVEPERVLPTSELVQAMYGTVLAFSEPGDGIILHLPIYPPFLASVDQNGRRRVENLLVDNGTRFEIDFDALRKSIDPSTRIWMFCNPHNPTGRAFTRAELEKVAEIAIERDLIVLCDEIHSDLMYAPNRHTPLASISPEIAARTITITSATKSFNIPGLRCALMHFGSEDLQQRFNARIPERLFGGLNSIGVDATVAAWRSSDDWLAEVMKILTANRETVRKFTTETVPAIKHRSPEATYLAWLDCSGLPVQGPAQDFFLEKAKVALNNGGDFGAQFKHCVRLNFGTSPAILEQVLGRMQSAIAKL